MFLRNVVQLHVHEQHGHCCEDGQRNLHHVTPLCLLFDAVNQYPLMVVESVLDLLHLRLGVLALKRAVLGCPFDCGDDFEDLAVARVEVELVCHGVHLGELNKHLTSFCTLRSLSYTDSESTSYTPGGSP